MKRIMSAPRPRNAALLRGCYLPKRAKTSLSLKPRKAKRSSNFWCGMWETWNQELGKGSG